MRIDIEIPDDAPFRLVSIQHRSWNEAWTVFLVHRDWHRSSIAFGYETKYDINEAFEGAKAMFLDRDARYDEIRNKENEAIRASRSQSSSASSEPIDVLSTF